jgi:hypothetical protein
MPQAPRPAPGQRPAPPQSRQTQRPPQPRGPQPQAQPPQAPAPRPPQPSEAELLEAAFGPAAAQKAPEPPKKRGRSRLLKLGIIVLVLAAIAAGLALLYVYAPGTVGNAPATGTTDPDDPRSKKTDRLPDAPPPPAQ